VLPFVSPPYLTFVNFRPYWVHIYEIQLTGLSSNNDMVPEAFHLIRTITLPSHKTVRALNTRERIVALSSSSTVELVKWDEGPISDQNERKLVIALHPEDLEDLVSNDNLFCSLVSSLDFLVEWNHCHSFYGTVYPNIQNKVDRVTRLYISPSP